MKFEISTGVALVILGLAGLFVALSMLSNGSAVAL